METEIKEISFGELLGKMDPTVRERIKQSLVRHQSTIAVLFENLDLRSRFFGARSVLGVGGADNTYKTLDEVRGQHLGQVPSVFQYPVAWAAVPIAVPVVEAIDEGGVVP